MSPTGRSWHIPYIHKYRKPPPDECINVVFLQRVTDEESTQIVENLKEVDDDWINKLAVSRPPIRSLEIKKWIRDYWPSSDVILEIAKHANSTDRDDESTYRSIIFVDSGWEAGNVIAARWEGEGINSRLQAARVPMNIAEPLLSACDTHKEKSLANVLGAEAYEESKIDFYVDSTESVKVDRTSEPEKYTPPDHLNDVTLNRTEIVIVSLRVLDQSEIDELRRAILHEKAEGNESPSIRIVNWEGTHVPRTELRKIFFSIKENSKEVDRNMPLILVENICQGENGQPQLLTALETREGRAVQLMPIKTEKLLELCTEAKRTSPEKSLDVQEQKWAGIWNEEIVYDLNVHHTFSHMDAAPVFFLEPLSLEQERTVRSKLEELNDVEADEDWGADWIYLGYIFPDKQKHTLEDLRDLFESCDRFSPSFDPKKPGPYQFFDYPHHFIAVDEHIFEAEPKVWLVSSLDFHMQWDDISDELGWFYGLVDAKEAHLNWVNLDIANMGPDEMTEELHKLWLSDLKEARKEYEALEAEDFA